MHLGSTANALTIAVDPNDQDILKISFVLGYGVSKTGSNGIPLNVNVDALGGLLGLQGDGRLNVAANASLGIELGVDLADPFCTKTVSVRNDQSNQCACGSDSRRPRRRTQMELAASTLKPIWGLLRLRSKMLKSLLTKMATVLRQTPWP